MAVNPRRGSSWLAALEQCGAAKARDHRDLLRASEASPSPGGEGWGEGVRSSLTKWSRGRGRDELFALGVAATLLGPLHSPVSWGEEEKKCSLEIFVEKALAFTIVVRNTIHRGDAEPGDLPFHSKICLSARSFACSLLTPTFCTGVFPSMARQAAVAADWPSTMKTGSMRIEP